MNKMSKFSAHTLLLSKYIDLCTSVGLLFQQMMSHYIPRFYPEVPNESGVFRYICRKTMTSYGLLAYAAIVMRSGFSEM